MGEIWIQTQIPQIGTVGAPIQLFPQSIFLNGALWFDVIASPSQSEQAGNARAWTNIYFGNTGNPIIPLINDYSTYNFPFVDRRFHYNIWQYYAYCAAPSGTTLTAAQLPYLNFVGAY